MEMKRLSISARHRAAHKAQENPHGAVVVMLLFLITILLAARTANAQWATMNKYTEFGKGKNIFCYYMENRYRYFNDIEESNGRIAVVHDPTVNTSSVLTSFNATLVEEK